MVYPKLPNKHMHEALFNPIDFLKYKKIKEKLPKKWIIVYQTHALNYIKRKYKGQYWHALPKEIASFWAKNMVVKE